MAGVPHRYPLPATPLLLLSMLSLILCAGQKDGRHDDDTVPLSLHEGSGGSSLSSGSSGSETAADGAQQELVTKETADLNALGVLCMLLDRSPGGAVFKGKLISSRPDNRIEFDQEGTDAPKLLAAGGQSGPFVSVLVPAQTERSDLTIRVHERLEQLGVADIRMDARLKRDELTYVKLTYDENAKILSSDKMKKLTETLRKEAQDEGLELPNCWLMKERANGSTDILVNISPPGLYAECLQLKAVTPMNPLPSGSIEVVLEQGDAKSRINEVVEKVRQAKKAKEDEKAQKAAKEAAKKVAAAAEKVAAAAVAAQEKEAARLAKVEAATVAAQEKKTMLLLAAIGELEQVLSAHKECAEAAIPAAVRAIKAASTKAEKVHGFPAQKLQDASTRITELEQQKTPKKRKRSLTTVQTPGGVSTTPCPVADEEGGGEGGGGARSLPTSSVS